MPKAKLADVAGGVAEELHFERFAGLAAGREDRRRSREAADVDPVGVATAAIAGLANLDDILSVRGRHDGGVGVLNEQRGVVGLGKHLAGFIEDGNIGVEHRAAEAHAFDFHGERFALLEFDRVVVHILIAHGAQHGGVKGDLLGLFGRVVRLFLVHLREWPDYERAEVRDARLGANANLVLA